MSSTGTAPEIALPGGKLKPAAIPELARFGFVAAAYSLGVWGAHTASIPPAYIAPVWPPIPILLCALLLVPTRHWWAYLLIPFGAEPIWWAGVLHSWHYGLLSSTANSIEALTIATALRVSGIGIPKFGRLRQEGLYFGIAAVAIAIPSIVGVFAFRLAGYGLGYWQVWRDWYVADLLSHFTLAPLLLTWAGGGAGWLVALPRRRRLEGLLLLAGLVPTVLCALGAPASSSPGVIYLPLPFLLWATLRFGVVGTYAALSLTAVLSIWHVARLHALGVEVGPSLNIPSIQAFLVATALPMSTLTAVLSEREETRWSLLRRSARLAAAKEEAQAANRAKDEFLSVLSHELRTPLTPVLLTASLLDACGDLPDHAREHVRTIRRCIELEARLIDDLLDVTRIARGKLQLRKETVDVHEAARQAIRLCCREQEQVSVRTDLLAKHPYAYVDPARLQQVVWNLVSNAIKFTPSGGRITVRSKNPMPGRLCVEVSDTGIGIAPEVLPKLFKAFEQGDLSTTRQFGGLGLGLAISKAITELHGGTLTVASPGVGQGATFTLELATVPASIEAPGGLGQPSPRAGARRPLRILLVEDNPQTLKILALFLRKLGHHVRPADTQQAALAADRQEEFDLVISDLGLPDGSGHRLMRELRERHAHLLGIAVSGYGAEADIRMSEEAGFARHLTKPVTIEQLESVLEQVTA